MNMGPVAVWILPVEGAAGPTFFLIMEGPIEYSHPIEGLDNSLRTFSGERALREGTFYIVDQPYRPLDMAGLVRTLQGKWETNRRLYQEVIDANLYPDGRAHPRSRELWPNPAALHHFRKVHRPPLFRGAQYRLASLKEDRTPLGVVFYRMEQWLPWSMEPEQLGAKDYQRECRRLQATKAGRRAKRLLMDNLTEAQRHDYYTKGVFVVAGNGSPRRHLYIIDNSFPNGNIFELKRGSVIANYCFHPEDAYPLDDILLTQKMLIESDEAAFRKEANGSQRSETDYWMPRLSGYPIAEANREWSGNHSFVPPREPQR